MRILLIVNTTASSVTARKRIVIRKALAADHDVEVAETSRRGHATRLARGAANAGVDVVVVLAGDGTLNEAADGLAGTATALAPLPGGSTNVYARTLGIPDDAIEATGMLLGSLGRHRFRRVGLGAVDGRRFLFHAGIGFDAAVIARVERHAELKRFAAHPLYVATAFDTWFRHWDRTTRCTVELPGGERIEDCGFVIVSKTTPYTYLGHRPVHAAPDAGLDTPLALTAFRRTDARTLIASAASALRSGRWLRRQAGIVHRHDLDAVTVAAERPLPYQVDGDALGTATRLDFAYEPRALTIVTP